MSNILSIQNNLFEKINLGYNFSTIMTKSFEHEINTEISINNFVTNFYYEEKKEKLDLII